MTTEYSSRLASEVHQTLRPQSNTMLRITTKNKPGKVLLTVEGRIASHTVGTLEQCWRELRAASPDAKFCLGICAVTFIDGAGKSLLKEIHREGGRLVAEGCLNQAIVKEITGEEKGKKERQKGSHIIFYVAFFAFLLSPILTHAQAQKPQSLLPPNAPTEVLRLSLEQAVATALKQNTTAQIAILTASQSEQDRKIALSQLLPQADFGVTDQWERENLKAFFGGSSPFPSTGLPGGFTFALPGHIGPYNIFQAGPSFNGQIFDLTLFRRYHASKNFASASKEDSFSTRKQVILLVVSQYIGTLRSAADGL